MSNVKSVFLDLCRLVAALLVVYGHIYDYYIPNHSMSLFKLYNLAHFSVVIFFVLSGYVIGYTTQNNNRGPVKYAVARLSRLTSLIIPALLITLILELILTKYQPDFVSYYQRGNNLVRYIITASFLNEIWIFSAAPPLNGPLWSVSFEFFYYCIFGIFFFARRLRNKIIYTTLVCLIAGPKILVMLPIWLMGLFALILSDKFEKLKNAYLFVLFLLVTYLSFCLIKPIPYILGYTPFFFANQFITDWIVGFFFTFTILSLPNFESLILSKTFTMNVRKIADSTFPIYVFHYPILLFFKAMFYGKLPNYELLNIALIVTLTVSVLLGLFFDKYRFVWISLFNLLFTKIKIYCFEKK